MNTIIIEEIKSRMMGVLQESQMYQLESVLKDVFNIRKNNKKKDYIKLFIFAKKSEGRSNRTETYYSQVLRAFEKQFPDIRFASTDDIRKYLYDYINEKKCSPLSIDNIRRILSSFYNWLENENYIIKSPMRRIGKIKIPVIIKSVYSDEELETMRDAMLSNKRNTAIFNLLLSSGMRIGELVALNIKDINFKNQSIVVYGKGNKERCVYFDIKTKISLQKYLISRNDNIPALFITERQYKKDSRKRRLSINQIEKLIRKYGKENNINAYPHKFRRTMATKAIDKGMPIEQVQILLGHSKIDTTLCYAQVQQKNVQNSYNKYIA